MFQIIYDYVKSLYKWWFRDKMFIVYANQTDAIHLMLMTYDNDKDTETWQLLCCDPVFQHFMTDNNYNSLQIKQNSVIIYQYNFK